MCSCKEELLAGAKFSWRNIQKCDECKRMGFSNKEDVYLFVHGLPERPVCTVCSSPVKFQDFHAGFTKTCGKECFRVAAGVRMKERCHNYTEEDKARVLRKRIETNMSKYGVPCALRSEQALEKTKQTLLARYGVENVLLSPEIKERVRSTNRERYGVDNPFSSPVIQEKIRETSIYTYGVDNPAKSAGVQAKITATNQERYGVDVVFQAEVIKERSKATCLEKYGVPYASMDEQIKARTRETNMRVYGFENPAASDVVKRKIEQSFKYYDFTFPSGTSVKVQGYEGQYITALLDKGVPEESIVIRPREFEYTHPSGKLRRYRPDVYLTTEDFFYEVKSTYTLYRYVWENIAKAEGVIKAGCNLMFVVLSEKGKIKEQVTLDVLRARSENSDQPQWWKEYEWYR